MKKLIPRIIFSSFRPELSENSKVKQIHEKWKKLNPDMEVKYFSDLAVKAFFSKEGSQWQNEYKMLTNGVAIADFFRICYIYKHGGIWMDFDVIPFDFLNRFEDSHLNNENLFFDLGWKNISYVMIAGVAGSKLFREAINHICSKIRRRTPNCITGQYPGIDITGPGGFQDAMRKVFDFPCHEGKFEAKNCVIKSKCGQSFFYVKHPLGARGLKSGDYNKLQKELGQLPWNKTLRND